jgi:hypothetical protein
MSAVVEDTTFGQTTVTLDRRATVLPVAVLAVLNLADVLLTRIGLRLGAVESNPVARVLLVGGHVQIVKAGLICLLALRMAHRRPTLRLAITCWAVTGAYAMVVVSNAVAIWTLRGGF